MNVMFDEFQGLSGPEKKKFLIWERFKNKLLFEGRHIVTSIHMRMEHAVFHPDTTEEQILKACKMLDEEIKERM